MKWNYIIMLTIMIIIVVTGFTYNAATTDPIPYPEGYRRWTHIKSSLLSPEHPNVKYRGFNHVYANEKAFQGYESGAFPEGSVIVFDVIKASTDNNHTTEGKRDHLDVMLKDSIKFSITGGWGYAQFDEAGTPKILTESQTRTCYNCHIKQNDHVFSEFRK